MAAITGSAEDLVRALLRSGPGGPVQSREVHLWTVSLEASDRQVEMCHSWLSPAEASRAAGFRFDQHRRDFVLSHGVLRALLGRFVEKSPGDLSFTSGLRGKPALGDPAHPLRFNMSRSGSLAVYAFTVECEIGIDVEQIQPVPEMAEIAARFFTAEEATELMALSEPQRLQGFFNCWTRKEAYVKAVGEGLSVPLASFRVTLQPGDPARLLSLAGDDGAAKRWTFHHWTPPPNYVCALAYPDRSRPVRLSPTVQAGELLNLL
jgi:4'-phosphopantetheinyl transferase